MIEARLKLESESLDLAALYDEAATALRRGNLDQAVDWLARGVDRARELLDAARRAEGEA